MLLLTGPTWSQFDFSQTNSNNFIVNDKPILLSDRSLIQGNHAARTSETIWDGCIILSKFLEKQQKSLNLNGARIIELGAGRGIAGLAAGLLGAHVTITDLSLAISGIQKSIDLNQLEHCQALPLDWMNPICPDRFDYIIAADVVWIPELIEPLVTTLDVLFTNTTIMYLCHQTRSELADEQLFSLLEQRKYQYQKIDQEQLDYYYQKPNIHIYRINRLY